MISALLLPVLAQAATPDFFALDAYTPPSQEQDRLTVCMEEVRSDPSSAIASASIWMGEAHDAAERAYPQRCLGMAYTRLLRWQAAEQAFLSARTGTLENQPLTRSKLASMAGNAALADGRNDDALAAFALAALDADAAKDTVQAGLIQTDRSRALVGLGRIEDAAAALAQARRDAPQNADTWLLSATLARRQGDLATAQPQIQTAAGLDASNPAIGLEAGVIAVLAGSDDAARQSWNSVIAIAPGSPEAETARGYLAQISDNSAAPAVPAPENSR